MLIFFIQTLLLLGSMNVNAATVEAYHRPSIFDVPTQVFEFEERWPSIKKAQLIFVAQLLELYPDRTLYFLARDSEYLFDVAQLVTRDTSDFNRIHLLNITRSNMRDRNLVPYLNQNGISEENFRNGEKIVLIDTGYMGRIPDHIQFQFSEKFHKNINAQMILSKDRNIPLSRSFLFFFNKNVNQMITSQGIEELKKDLLNYEDLEKFTRRSTEFKRLQGLYHAMIPLKDPRAKSNSNYDKLLAGFNASENRFVDPAVGLRRMSDLKADWKQPAVQEFFLRTRQLMRSLRQALISGEQSQIDQVKSDLAQESEIIPKNLVKAYVLDAYDILKKQGYKIKVNKAEFRFIAKKENICTRIF